MSKPPSADRLLPNLPKHHSGTVAAVRSPFDLTGKVALVTGAGRGIGFGIAQGLAEGGADIALNALTNRYLDAAAAEIAEATGRRVVAIAGDVTTPTGAQAVVGEALATFGAIDILCNNLGDSANEPLVDLPGANARAASDDRLAQIVDVNLTHMFHVTRAAGPQFLERRSGKVINTSSFAARYSGGDSLVYTTAKTAITGFTRALALQWAPFGIQVNALAPGIFPDPRTIDEDFNRRLEEVAKQQVPLARLGELHECGLLARYLASSASDYMTGQTIYLDGGLSLGRLIIRSAERRSPYDSSPGQTGRGEAA